MLFTQVRSISQARAEPRENVLERIDRALAQDKGLNEAERSALEEALHERFGAYGTVVIDPAHLESAQAALHVIAEGEMDSLPAARIADVAFAAFQAIYRGAPAEVAQGIALYGYRKQIDAERISLWANGYRLCTERGVPPEVAADLVRLAMESSWDERTFDTLKWALVSGVQQGYDARLYAGTLFARLKSHPDQPGEANAYATHLFAEAAASHQPVPKPDYQGEFNAHPSSEPEKGPEPANPRPERPGTRSQHPIESHPGEERFAALWPELEHAVRSYLGTPYVWGGQTHAGIDCSGLTQVSYAAIEIALPRIAREQWQSGRPVESQGELREGDLIFFDTLGSGVSHVGLVVDGRARRFIHASSSHGVTEASLGERYYQARYLGARRELP